MSRAAPVLAALALGLAGCEAAFDPIADSDRAYSLSGYLEAGADTQWVRVERFDGALGRAEPAPLDVAVTLSRPGHAPVPLAQEVRPLVTGPAHLFWTTAPVEAGATYRLEARGLEGEASAVIEVPTRESLEVEVVPGPNNCPLEVLVRAERVADVQTRYVVRARSGRVTERRFSHLYSLRDLGDGWFRALIYSGDDTQYIDHGFGDVLSSDVVVAGATDAWPETLGLTLETAIATDGRVENGAGFVGGVVTDRTPFTPVYSTGFSCMSGRR